MQIPPTTPLAGLAGAGRAAAKGGEADKQATEATQQTQNAERPGGKSPEMSALEAGEQTGDRDANGRQMLDTFSSGQDEDENPEQDDPPVDHEKSEPPPSGRLDFKA